MAGKSRRKSDQPDVTQVMARMKPGPSRGRGRKSPLYLWLRVNHDRLLAEFEASTPSWEALATALGESGITNADKKPPTPTGARTTWYRVRRELADGHKVAGRRRSSIPIAPSVPTIKPPEQIGDNGESETVRRFRTVKLRNVGEQVPPPTATPKPASPEQGVNVDDVLSRFMPTARRD